MQSTLLFGLSLVVTGVIAAWGIVDTDGLAKAAARAVAVQFSSRSWFIMLTATTMLATSVWLALSRYGQVKLGLDDDESEFSTLSWLTMLFPRAWGSVCSIEEQPNL